MKEKCIMAQFKNEKKSCAICTNPTPKIFPTKIDNQTICKECERKISMEDRFKALLTMDKLRDHLTYREKNAKLHEEFTVTRKISTGIFGKTVCIDDKQQLWFVGEFGNEPIFRFKELEGFTLFEDRHILECGSSHGMDLFTSIVDAGRLGNLSQPEQEFGDSLIRIAGSNWIYNNKPSKNTSSINTSGINTPEQKTEAPVHMIRLEINLANLYWQKLKLNFAAPEVVDNDITRFIIDYRSKLEEIEEITQALMSFFLSDSNSGIFISDKMVAM
jgi:hypothetical protein